MSELLRSKFKVFLYTSLALLLSLGLASGFKWASGGDEVTVASAAPAPTLQGGEAPTRPGAAVALPAAGVSDQGTATDLGPVQTLADASAALVSIAKAVTPAVVSVTSQGAPRARTLTPEDFFRPFRRQPGPEDTPFDVPLGRGSGFIVTEDGYILTNNHVVSAAERIVVELPDGRRFPKAEIVGRDPTTDVAVIKINQKNLPTIPLGSSESAAVGEFVMAIGNPGAEFGEALPFTVTAGIISAKGRNLGIIRRATDESNYVIEDLIQTDAVINPGNSGGPLVNYRGEVIGINTAIASTTGFYQGYGFAIPITLARSVMDDLIEFGRVRRAALGVQVTGVTSADKRVYQLPDLKGAVVQDFPDKSPARQAGIQREDVIVAVDAKLVERVGQLQRFVAAYNPGDVVRVKVIRFGKERTFQVRLTEAPVPQAEVAMSEPTKRSATTLIGVQVRDFSTELAREAGLPVDADLDGVMVERVAPFGPAWNAGLQTRGWVIQRVNGERIRNERDFDEALAQLKPGDVVSLQMVYPGDRELLRRTYNIELPKE